MTTKAGSMQRVGLPRVEYPSAFSHFFATMAVSRPQATTSRSKAAKKKKPAKAGGKKAAAVSDKAAKTQATKVLRRLKADYPEAECALVHRSAFELLIATILSAQCTDVRVNIVTKDLFAKYPTAADFAAAPLRSIEKAVQSTGFFRNKAKNIQTCCRVLADKYDGEVPQTMEQLVELAGVGRKTANVVLGTAYGMATGVVVDTHVGRLSRRLGLTQQTDAVKVEADLMQILPRKQWVGFSHRMIHHGRQVCASRKAKCDQCSMQKFCPRIGID